MGVVVNPSTLEQAKVSVIHFSKNIVLNAHSTCSMILDELAKSKVGSRLNFTKTDYLNGGQAIRFTNQSYELILYDKIKEVGGNIASSLPRLNVLRIEARFKNLRQVKQLVKSYLISDTTFQTLFNRELAKEILTGEWARLIHNLPLLAMTTDRPEDIMRALELQLPTAKRRTYLQLLAFLVLEKSIGKNGLCHFADKRLQSSFTRYKRQIRVLGFKPDFKTQEIQHITRELNKFESF